MYNLKIIVKLNKIMHYVCMNESALGILKMPFVTSVTFVSRRAKVLTVYKSLPNISHVNIK